MIQIYSKGNTKYDMNGDMTLFPKSCIAEAEINGTWKMEMVHPRDQEGRWRHIEEECVISAPTFVGDKQLFRIGEVEKTDEEVTATAFPVFMDAGDDCFLMDVRPTAKNGQEALNMMMSGSRYSGESNITTAATAYFVERNLMDAINGKEEPTFISRWGGEILYDNYKIIINERVGGDYGVEVRYGKNLEGIEHTLDMSGVVTRIIPVAYNGHKMSGSAPWVDSVNISKYAKKYIRKIKFDDVKMREDAQENDEENGITVCDTQTELNAALTARCKKAFESGLDLPVVSIEVRMIELSGTEEYKDVQLLEKVGLGDDIRCRHKELGITTKERVVKVAWDCCRNRVEKLTLGASLYNYFSDTNASLDSIGSILDMIGGTIGDDGSVMAGKIKGFIDATKAQLRLQNSVAKKQVVRAILFEDLDPDSELYGAMALGTLGLQIAKRRTADQRDWDWTTALTANGLIANVIVAGILSDKRGKNYWNLDTGEFALSATGFKIDGQTADDYFKENWTQEEVFNKLTNRGQTMGIYLSGGRLYLNAQYMQIGKISSRNGKVYFDLDNNELVCSKMISVDTKQSVKTVVDVGYPPGISTDTNSRLRIYPQGYVDKAIEIFAGTSGGGTIEGAVELRMQGGNYLSNITVGNNTVSLSASPPRDSTSAKYAQITMNSLYSSKDNGDVRISPYLTVGGHMNVQGTLTAVGTKSRIAETKDYGDRLLYCYETPSPMFGDIGEGETDENGECYVSIEDVFAETIDTAVEYQVFLQKEGEGDLWVDEKESDYFLVKGTGNLKFSWEIKAVQREYECERLEEFYENEAGMAEIVDMEIDYTEREWQEKTKQDEADVEEMWCREVQESGQEEAEKEDVWHGITQELYGD